MTDKKNWILILIACAAILTYSARRDYLLRDNQSGDLRNRVVGARMIADGRSPYFYKWTPGDDLRTYDPQNFDSLKVSNVTATPFFHRLLIPIAEMPQKQISLWWLIIEYTLLLLMIAMALSFAKTTPQRMLVAGGPLLFLFTDSWKMHIYMGQYYLVIPFLAMTVFFLLQLFCRPGRQRYLYGFAAGLVAASMVLIRPNSIVYLLPLLFLFRKYPASKIAVLLAPFLILATWIVTSRTERFLWLDYQKAMTEQLKIHQHLHPALRDKTPDPDFPQWEGIVYGPADSPSNGIHTENGNFFVLVTNILHVTLSVNTLLALSALVIVTLTWLYYRRNRGPEDFDPFRTALFAYSLYWITDLFSPIYRHQYYTVQCLFPLLIAALLYRPALKGLYWLLLAGILLNINRIPFIKMQHTIGEYLILSVTILLAMIPGEKQPAGTTKNTL